MSRRRTSPPSYRGLAPVLDYEPSDLVVVTADAGTRDRMVQLDRSLEGRALLWEEPPARGRVTAVALIDRTQMKTDVPRWLRTFGTLSRLDIPAHLFPRLEGLPKLVAGVLCVGGSGTVALKAPLPDVSLLVVSDDATLHFEPEHLPSLRGASVRLNTKQSALESLAAMPLLSYVGLRPVKASKRLFEALAGIEALRYLRLVSGSLGSLRGIEKVQQLASLHLQNLPKLKELSPLADLEGLEELTVYYCRNIDLKRVLSALHKLRSLCLFGCDDLGLTHEEAEALRRRIAVVDLGDSDPSMHQRERPRRGLRRG